jgi:hypothetical protein
MNTTQADRYPRRTWQEGDLEADHIDAVRDAASEKWINHLDQWSCAGLCHEPRPWHQLTAEHGPLTDATEAGENS